MNSLADVERLRHDAMMSGDVDALTELLHPDGWYCHGSGERERNAEWLDLMRSGFYRFKRIAVADQHVMEMGSVAVVLSTLTMEVTVNGRDITAPRQSTNVWKRWCDGRWRLLVYTGAAVGGDGGEDEKDSPTDARATG
jgi:ketosteroid isomerase-like protein